MTEELADQLPDNAPPVPHEPGLHPNATEHDRQLDHIRRECEDLEGINEGIRRTLDRANSRIRDLERKLDEANGQARGLKVALDQLHGRMLSKIEHV